MVLIYEDRTLKRMVLVRDIVILSHTFFTALSLGSSASPSHRVLLTSPGNSDKGMMMVLVLASGIINGREV